ncbi:MAG: DHHA1 domain-containing protein [Chloroflexi bacterium]|nr:DHHA1 domain-containing protein [Chloroflexota bacterium]
MTERLYYTDAYQTEFDAQLVAAPEINHQAAVLLDRTSFYPTSGGQLFDTGYLGDRRVIDVIATENGDVLHVLDSPLAHVQPGQTVHGVVDWPRRYDHMQQHSGQHLLSQIFYRHFGYETVSVHFGDTESTLDLEIAALDQTQLDAAEKIANEMVYASLPIKAYFVNDRELATVPLRKPPKVTGKIRIVEIDQFDYSACGGTHVRTTAEVGTIKFTRLERRRNQVRLTFLCGQRAYQDYAEKHRLLTEAATLFSTELSEVPRLVERNLAQIKELQAMLKTFVEEQLVREASALVSSAHVGEKYQIVAKVFADKDAGATKTVAQNLQQYPGTLALLAATGGGKLTLLFARSADVDVHMGNLLRDTLRQFGGSGGGRPDFAQGGGVDPAMAQTLLDFAVQQLAMQKIQ